MAKLVVTCDETGRREFVLDRDIFLGRSAECEVPIPSALVSRRHAKISIAEGGYVLEDLGSSNGTFLNGNRIQKNELRDGDKITIGNSEIMLLIDDYHTLLEPDLSFDDSDATVIGTLDVGAPSTEESDMPDSAVAKRLRTRLETLQQVAETSCGALVISTLVERILQQLLSVYPQADHAHAVLIGFSEPVGDLRLSAARDRESPPDVGMSRTLLDIATRERKAVLAGNVDSVKRLKTAESIMAQRLRSMMCCPLVMGSRMLGAIQVDTAGLGQPFSTDDLKLLVTIARQVAIAAENARLHREMVAQQRLAAVGHATSSLAHCMKNVLNNVQGGAYILDLGIKRNDPEKLAKGWEMVKRNNNFMTDLVKDMLAFCRKGGPDRHQTDMGGFLEETLAMVQEYASQREVETSLEIAGEAPTLEIDPLSMKRAVLNLLTNAVEACPKGGSVKLIAGTDKASGRFRITVEDDGPGIPPDVKKRLFEAFFTTKGNKGTGLGLALVHKVVEEHGGRVDLDSEVGRGTAFHVLLPVGKRASDTAVR